jgi:DNA-binding NtrC family response regulator
MDAVRVLLVDDEAEFVSALAERLELRGYQVATAESGETALEILTQDLPQVVVLDIRMPGMDGKAVLETIRTRHPGLPVIMLTGYGSTRDEIENMQRGAFDIMVKPIDIDALTEKIAEATS